VPPVDEETRVVKAYVFGARRVLEGDSRFGARRLGPRIIGFGVRHCEVVKARKVKEKEAGRISASASFFGGGVRGGGGTLSYAALPVDGSRTPASVTIPKLGTASGCAAFLYKRQIIRLYVF
jgi:hypothetical protein